MSAFPRESASHPAPPAFKNHQEEEQLQGLSQPPSELRNPVLSVCPALFPLEFLKL